MKYLKADIFPADLLAEIQKYAQGQLVYIPIPKEAQKKWGESSGTRSLTTQRNLEMQAAFLSGQRIEQLADQYHLSIDSVKKIVYKKY